MSARQVNDPPKGPTSPKSPLGQSYSLPDDDYGDAVLAQGNAIPDTSSSSAALPMVQASADSSIATAIPGLNAVPTPSSTPRAAPSISGRSNATLATATQSPTARTATLRGASLSPLFQDCTLDLWSLETHGFVYTQ
ncbi:hypothetical protein CBOM_04375 [Ceraceosorus bombacis]|uniref:Uncharacterized protein n=1 Tax=Ceraceosorus bombacis TaxID=401625 RepID=A0A0P1BHR4_9BASI|nr:hypothetical protein CBOM_04375 [Ceraceosorus bombacis]